MHKDNRLLFSSVDCVVSPIFRHASTAWFTRDVSFPPETHRRWYHFITRLCKLSLTVVCTFAGRPEKHRHIRVISAVIVSFLFGISLAGIYFLWKQKILQNCLHGCLIHFNLSPKPNIYQKTEKSKHATRLWSTKGSPRENTKSCDGPLYVKAPSGGLHVNACNDFIPIRVIRPPR